MGAALVIDQGNTVGMSSKGASGDAMQCGAARIRPDESDYSLPSVPSLFGRYANQERGRERLSWRRGPINAGGCRR